MHVAVLGAGVTGVTSAYYLAELGHSVTLIERAATVAAATSHANGGQLSYSYTDSLARPEFVPRIPGLVLGLDPAIDVGILRNLRLFPWGLRFLGQCTSARARENTLAVLDIAMRSAILMDDLQSSLGLEFAYRTAGKLVVLADEKEVPGAKQRAAMKREHGCETEILTPDDAIALEPSLAAMQQRFAAAVYSADDQVGDAAAFTNGLVDWLQRHRPVQLLLDEEATAIDARDGTLRGVQTERRFVDSDAAVVCLGPWSGRLLKSLGIDPLIYPVRGYSVTLPVGEHPPTVSITNLEHRIVFSLLGDRVRIAGFADFVGYRTDRDGRRQRLLIDIAKTLAPWAADYDCAERFPWGGFRPVTPTGRPVVGPTRIPGLFLNTGHGVLGWTLACATGHDVARAVSAQ